MAIDWRRSMRQSFEYYRVDPITWKDVEKLDFIESCSITRDLETDTLGSATFTIRDPFQENYIRVYLIATQGETVEKVPLGTFLAQSSRESFDGRVGSVDIDAYTPLLELKENQPPIGYYIPKNTDIAEEVERLTRANCRIPVVPFTSDEVMQYDFVSNDNDTWMSYLNDFAAVAKFYYDLDELSQIVFSPIQELASLQPKWEFSDEEMSIMQPEITIDRDIYGVPNVVEVIYSAENYEYEARAVNDDPSSIVSTVSRGREITKRITNPSFPGTPTQGMVEEYAQQQLKELSTVSYTISYKHGYCPVRPGDGIRFNYYRYNLIDVKAKVISQTFNCETSCQVSEKAVFTKELWDWRR